MEQDAPRNNKLTAGAVQSKKEKPQDRCARLPHKQQQPEKAEMREKHDLEEKEFQN